MEKIVFTSKIGPNHSSKGASFIFNYDHFSESNIYKKNVEVIISDTLISLYEVDAKDGEIFFNCLLKEVYRNGIKNLEDKYSKILICIEENQHLYDPEHSVKFVPKYEIDI